MRWVGVAGSRAFSLSDPTAREETVLLHMLRGERERTAVEKKNFRFKQPKSFCKKTPLRDFPKFTQTQMH